MPHGKETGPKTAYKKVDHDYYKSKALKLPADKLSKDVSSDLAIKIPPMPTLPELPIYKKNKMLKKTYAEKMPKIDSKHKY